MGKIPHSTQGFEPFWPKAVRTVKKEMKEEYEPERRRTCAICFRDIISGQ